jgi:hypothetical protein
MQLQNFDTMKLHKWVQSVAVVAGETQISALAALSLVFGERVRERERAAQRDEREERAPILSLILALAKMTRFVRAATPAAQRADNRTESQE